MPAPRRPATRPATASDAELARRKGRLAALCMAYPGTTAHSPWDNEHLSFEVAGKRFGYYLQRHFGDDGRSGAVFRAAPGAQGILVEADPDRFWVPAFVGRHGWVGIRLDLEEPDWDGVALLLHDAWMLTAPRRLRDAFAAVSR